MRARTMQLLSDLTGVQVPEASEAERATARQLAEQIDKNPGKKVDLVGYPNETIAYLAQLVGQMCHDITENLGDLKKYVVAKLIHEAEHAASSKDRIAALEKLGNVDGVNAFKKQSEMTVKIQNIDDVERELKSILEGIEYKEVSSDEPKKLN